MDKIQKERKSRYNPKAQELSGNEKKFKEILNKLFNFKEELFI